MPEVWVERAAESPAVLLGAEAAVALVAEPEVGLAAVRAEVAMAEASAGLVAAVGPSPTSWGTFRALGASRPRG